MSEREDRDILNIEPVENGWIVSNKNFGKDKTRVFENITNLLTHVLHTYQGNLACCTHHNPCEKCDAELPEDRL